VLQYTTDMRYTPITEYADYLFPDYLFGVQSAWPWEWGATVLIGIALIGGIVGRRTSTFVVIAITAFSGLVFRFWEDLQATTAWNLRFLPFWYLGVFLLLGLGGAELVRGAAWTARWGAREWGTRVPPRVLGAVTRTSRGRARRRRSSTTSTARSSTRPPPCPRAACSGRATPS
jgi:hypothetical protein